MTRNVAVAPHARANPGRARSDALLAQLRRTLATDSEQPEVQVTVAALLLEQGRPREALEHLSEALRQRPDHVAALYNRGNAHLSMREPALAAENYRAALRLDPTLTAALNNLGTALHRLRRLDEALTTYQQVLKAQPEHAGALNNCANVLRDMHRLEEALRYCEAALRLRPRYPGALTNRGNTLARLHRGDAALASFEAALTIDPAFSLAWHSRGLVLKDQGQLEGAMECFERALRGSDDCDEALGGLREVCRQIGDWSDDDALAQRLCDAVRSDRRATLPFLLLAVTDQPQLQQACARLHLALESATPSASLAPAKPYEHDRVRVGYLSADFRDHPVAFLMAGVLEQHDRERFHISALSLRAPDGSSYAVRIGSAVDQFIDLSTLSDAEAAERIRSLEIDLLIDLAGYTQGARPGLHAYRAAPLQVSYLGYPGTLGSPDVDYLIADAYLIPEAQRPHYSEQIVYLPECFQANDDRRVRLPRSSRAECGLPEDALVLCCFNNTYKIGPTFFEIWMRLLQAVPHSLLWLVATHELTVRNLRREAAARGIDPERLHFAPALPYGQHLARLGCADLFLDTLPFNGGTTVSDALWSGLPVLTVSGEAFAARMAGSLLHSIGLSELIARDLPHYEALALELLHDPERLRSLRAQLCSAAGHCALFNTARFTRHLERAFQLMLERQRLGLPPAHLSVEPLP